MEQDSKTDGMNRRGLLGRAGIGALGTALLGTMGPVGAILAGTTPAHAQTVTDQDILNFALNLEYLESNYYLLGVTGQPLPASLATGTGVQGAINGGRQVPFQNVQYFQFAQRIAVDEQNHVNFLRGQLGSAAVAQPTLDFNGAFQTAALNAGVIAPGQFFSPFTDEISFFLGAAALTDVGVTAYAGAAALIRSTAVLNAAASILATEAYHAGSIRAVLGQAALSQNGQQVALNSTQIATLENNLSNAVAPSNPINAQGIVFPTNPGVIDIVPTDGNFLVFRRTPAQVLNVVYGGNLTTSDAGGFFPSGLNGTIR